MYHRFLIAAQMFFWLLEFIRNISQNMNDFAFNLLFTTEMPGGIAPYPFFFILSTVKLPDSVEPVGQGIPPVTPYVTVAERMCLVFANVGAI